MSTTACADMTEQLIGGEQYSQFSFQNMQSIFSDIDVVAVESASSERSKSLILK